MKQAIIIVLITLAIVGTVLLSRGPRAVGTVENIEGIPFPSADDKILITEKLAHADIYLQESVFAKQLKLTITFIPLNTKKLEVGIRENSFWLSYVKQELYRKPARATSEDKSITKTVTIPLTDKLADKDGSIDLMFFASNRRSTTEENEGINDTTLWYLQKITADIVPVLPTIPATKDYLRSIVKREKAL